MVVDVKRETCDLRHLMGGSLEAVRSVGWLLFFPFVGVECTGIQMGCGVIGLLLLSALRFSVLRGCVIACWKVTGTTEMLQAQNTSQLNHVLDP